MFPRKWSAVADACRFSAAQRHGETRHRALLP
jgi:hypothetical protein